MTKISKNLSVFLPCLLTVQAWADVTVLTPTKDAFVSSAAPTVAHGSDDAILLGRVNLSHFIRGYIEFDLSNLPDDPELITLAVFRAYQSGRWQAAGGMDVLVRRLESAWNETTVTWNNKPVQNTTVWATASVGAFQDVDRWISWDVTDLVRAQASGQHPNFGWAFTVDIEQFGSSRLGYFHSREYLAKPNLRPFLEVTTAGRDTSVTLNSDAAPASKPQSPPILSLSAAAIPQPNTVVFSAHRAEYGDNRYPVINFTNSHELRIGRGPMDGQDVRGLVEFFIQKSALPENPARIASATLSVYQYSTLGDAGGRSVGVFRPTSAWGTTGGAWNVQPTYDGSVAYDVAMVGDPAANGWIGWDVTELMQLYASSDYVHHTVFTNQRWCDFCLVDLNEGAGAISIGYFDSGIYGGNPAQRPQLAVEILPAPGDMDGDGDLDVDDWTVFANCVSGPLVVSPPPGCTQENFDNADTDGDADVDLNDIADFLFLFAN